MKDVSSFQEPNESKRLPISACRLHTEQSSCARFILCQTGSRACSNKFPQLLKSTSTGFRVSEGSGRPEGAVCEAGDRAIEVGHHLEEQSSVETASTGYKSSACTEVLTFGMESAFRVGKSRVKSRDLIFRTRNSVMKFVDVHRPFGVFPLHGVILLRPALHYLCAPCHSGADWDVARRLIAVRPH